LLRNAGVTHIVALDGAYSIYPEGVPASDPDQHMAIMLTCRNLGMGCTIHVPETVWHGNEMEKRSFLFYLGLANADDGDWFFVMDADQTVIKIPDDFHERLAKTELEVATVTFADEGALYTRRILFRAQPILVVGNHFTYMTMDDRRLWGPSNEPMIESVNLVDMVIRHEPNRWRTEKRLSTKADYYALRDESGAELALCKKCKDHDEQAVKRIPHRWRKVNGQVLGDWIEVCAKHAKEVERENRQRLRKLGMDPDKVVPRYVLGDPLSQDKHVEAAGLG
jgi:hypothetical protein